MSDRTNEEALSTLDEVEELRDRLTRQYRCITQRDADDAAEWAYEEIQKAVATEREYWIKRLKTACTVDPAVNRYWLGWNDCLQATIKAIRARAGKEG